MSEKGPKVEISASKRTNRLKRRLDKDTTLEDLLEGWTQCCHLVARKQKLCNVARSLNSMFCGNHQPDESVEHGTESSLVCGDTKDAKKDKKERVPCPIDPTHTIFKSSLNYHIKVCTKLKQSKAMSEQAFFKQDCNSYSVTCMSCGNNEESQIEAAIDADALAAKINFVYAQIQAKCTESEDIATFQENNLNTTYAQTKWANTASANPTTVPATTPVSATISDDAVAAKIATKLGQDLTSFSKMRHVDQDILLVQQMRDRGLINTGAKADSTLCPAVYVELGAGRGLLSYAVSCADPTSTVVLVERYGSKKKIDKALKEDLAELKASLNSEDTVSGAENSEVVAGAINRVRMDIRHCYLPLLPGVVAARDTTADNTEMTQSYTNKQQPVVVIAKHLCGVATDLAIQSVASFPHIPVSSEATKQENLAHKVGIAIATCCHHACHFPDYTGRDWYLSQGFTAGEFEILKKWSGWSTNTVNAANTVSTSSTTADVSGNLGATVETGVADTSGGATDVAGDVAGDEGEDNTATENQHAAPRDVQVIRPTNITSEQMQILGWKVKRIIDQGRVEYIKKQYRMSAKQVRYCARRLSPECVLLVATQL